MNVRFGKSQLEESGDYPVNPHSLPPLDVTSGRYRVGLARDEKKLDAILRLRFDVFNLELGEGLTESYASLRDRDQYDPYCHHLYVEDIDSGAVVGTYRLLSYKTAADCGFYSDNEFDLARLPDEILRHSVELGRACVRHEHRNSRVLFLLWTGLAAYLNSASSRYFFGCCSLTSQDCREGWQVAQYLVERGYQSTSLHVPARAACRCEKPAGPLLLPARLKLPKLMQMYLDYGARIVSEPAIDRKFSTIDYLALFDIRTLDSRARKLFGLAG